MASGLPLQDTGPLSRPLKITLKKITHYCYNGFENVIYLITCKKCKKQYVGSCITRFRKRFNNYRSCHRKFCWGHSVIQVSFHTHFMLDEHTGFNDWEITLIDKGRNKQETRKKSFFGNISLTHLYRMVSMSE